MKVLGMEFRSDAENARVAGLVARTSVVRNSGILVCTRSEKAWLELGRGIEKPLSTRALGWLLEIAADKGSQEIREVAPDLGKRDARLHFMSASGFLCHPGRPCPECRERDALRPLLGGKTLAEAGLSDDPRVPSKSA